METDNLKKNTMSISNVVSEIVAPRMMLSKLAKTYVLF